MTKSTKLQSLVEEVAQPPASGAARRIYTAGKKSKLHKSQVIKTIADWVERTKWGVLKPDAEKIAKMYIEGIVGKHDRQYDPIEPYEFFKAYVSSKHFGYQQARNLFVELEKQYGHFRKFFADNQSTEWIYVQGKRITPAEDNGEKK